ncbi:MAG TPA: hypothetical protein VFX01_05350 [Methylophilaceae bacterium]|nr:hypothetical protein [Methylophilaceae bacterium]
MDTEHPEFEASRPSARRTMVITALYFFYLTVSFAALCFYLSRAHHASAYLLILAWLISVLLLPTPNILLLNRRKKDR